MTSTGSGGDLGVLLGYLKETRGFDFTGYKPTSLGRRVQKRMEAVSAESYADYVDYLQVHPEEFGRLFDLILINVTGFFRDGPAWEHLGREVVPAILGRKRPGEPVRVWSAGCSTGQEAYSAAMLLHEALGPDEYRQRVRVYATDVDEAALAQARLATYRRREVASLPPALLERHFLSQGDGYAVRPELRRCVIFGRHDLQHDAYISHIDLLLCRNTLMYFTAEVQDRVLARFHYALSSGGFLCLGKSEVLLAKSPLFAPFSLRHRTFTKVPRADLRDKAQPGEPDVKGDVARHLQLRDAALDAAPVAQVVVDVDGRVVLVNEQARSLFGLQSIDLGKPLRHLDLARRPLHLGPHLEKAFSTRTSLLVPDVAWQAAAGDTRHLDIHMLPLLSGAGAVIGASITFADNTRFYRMQAELERSTRDLRAAYEELHSATAELETTNEELQSTVEELETTNEELHSTNEELEAVNEEVSAANQHLVELNAFLQGIVEALDTALVVVDANLRVLLWNHGARDLWGLRDDEATGQLFTALDIGLPVASLEAALRACLSEGTRRVETTLPAVDRRGRRCTCRVKANLLSRNGDVIGLVITLQVVAEQP